MYWPIKNRNGSRLPCRVVQPPQRFEKKVDDYEENRHFLLAQYFRNNYNKAMSNLPVVNSQVQILRMEVWVTNRTGATTETSDVVGFMDLVKALLTTRAIQAVGARCFTRQWSQ